MSNAEQNELNNLLHNIRKLRKHNNLSKKQMASIMEVSIKTLNRIENGEMPPRLGANSIYNICVYFKVRSSTLFESHIFD